MTGAFRLRKEAEQGRASSPPRAVRRRIALERSCHLCGGGHGEIIAERDRHGHPLRTVLCPACGLVFTDPRPDSPTLIEFYRHDYRKEYKGAATPRATQVYRNAVGAMDRMARIGPYLSSGGKILDIGCGSGEFLYFLRRAGHSAHGIDPDVGCCELARDRLGLDVESRPLAPPAPAASPFSTITIFHVLEHLENPRGAFQLMTSWLRPGGRLVVEVPNVESRTTAPHHRFHRAHVFGFNTETLAALGEMSGIRVENTILTPDGGTITIVFVHQAPNGIRDLAGNAARVRQALDGYTNTRHYLGGTLVRQQIRKLGHSLRGRWLCRGLDAPEEVLERVADVQARVS